MTELTCDSLFDGRLTVRQHARGYRFSLDAVLAAHFVRPPLDGTVLDLCAGCGVIGLILAYRFPGIRVVAVELQAALAALIQANAEENGLQNRMRVFNIDAREVRQLLQPESCDLVVCNPPYRTTDSGRITLESEAAVARHEMTASMAEFIEAAAFAVRNRAPVVFIYPALRLAELVSCLQSASLVVKRIRAVYGYPGGGAANLVLVEAVKNGGPGCTVSEPLYVHTGKNGPYTPEIERFYRD